MNDDLRGRIEGPSVVAEKAEADLVYRSVVENVACGIMSLDTHGTVSSINAAGTEILGLKRGEIVGRNFGEVFSQTEGMDPFADAVFDAVIDSSMVHQRVIETTFRGRTRSLSLATSYLEDNRDGVTVRVGVIAMFNDISEIRELRENELRLAREMEAKHEELREAYVELEDSNRKLGEASKRINAIRLVAALMVLVLFLAVGVYFWSASSRGGGNAAVVAAVAPGELQYLTVEPQQVTSTVTLLGWLAPRREVAVTSPFEGKVAAVHVRPGDAVAAGQRLLEMDVSKVRIDHRDAQVAYIKARDRVEALENWSDNPDVSRLRRALSKSRIELEVRKNRLEETAFLLERGIVPASEHEAARREHRNQLLDVRSAEQDLQAILAKGEAEQEVAQLELDNARARLGSAEEILEKAVVRAPAAGVVMRRKKPAGTETGPDEEKDRLSEGAFVSRGDRLLTIGDLDGLTVVGTVDEVDVARIRPGRPATITGDAFPGMALRAEIERVSSQAAPPAGNRRLPSFEVAAVVNSLTEDQRRALRLGMSATVEVVVHEKADALLVPIGAVEVRGDRFLMRVRDRDTGEVRQVEVAVGMTTLDSVEVLDGIAAGDEIVVAGAAGP